MDKSTVQTDRDTQLQLDMAHPAFKLLDEMKTALEAATYGEVVRRAIQLYDACDVVLPPVSGVWEAYKGDVKRLHVRIPPRTSKLIDRRKTGKKTNSVIVTESLLLLAQVLRNQGRLKWKGDKNTKQTDRENDTIEDHGNILLTA